VFVIAASFSYCTGVTFFFFFYIINSLVLITTKRKYIFYLSLVAALRVVPDWARLMASAASSVWTFKTSGLGCLGS
jgi:hypothetical protein